MNEVFAREERAQSLVEFAIGVVLLLVILAGVIDLGRGFHAYVIITNAAREGARYGASYPEGDIKVKVIAEANGSGVILTTDEVNVSFLKPPEEANPKGFPVRVDVHYEFEPVLGAFLGLLKITLNSSAQMIVM